MKNVKVSHTKTEQELFKALRCLYIAVDRPIADSISGLVNDVLAEKNKKIADLEKEIILVAEEAAGACI